MKKRKLLLVLTSLLLVLLLAAGVFAAGSNRRSAILGKLNEVKFEPHISAFLTVVNSPANGWTSPASSFWIRFIDVGQGDAALIQCDGHYMMIDGGPTNQSSKIYSTLKSLDVPCLDIIVASHAHQDHVGGLSGALNYTTSKLTLCPVTYYDTESFRDFKSYAEKNGGGLTVPRAGSTYYLGSARVTVLSLLADSEGNNASIILRVEYGNTSFVFTGDAEMDAERKLLESEMAEYLDADLLKVGHHGSDDATTYIFLREIMPDYAVISCGTNNSYGHPHEATLSKLRDADCTVYRTDTDGTIICKSDGKRLSFSFDKSRTTIVADRTNTGIDNDSDIDYVLNTNTKKFHYPTCASAAKISSKNREEYKGDRDALIKRGYSPCGNCKP